MPRVLPLSRRERKKLEFKKWIKGKKAQEDVTNRTLAEMISVSPQAFGKKVDKSQYSYSELVEIFSYLKATDEEIVKMMRYERR